MQDEKRARLFPVADFVQWNESNSTDPGGVGVAGAKNERLMSEVE